MYARSVFCSLLFLSMWYNEDKGEKRSVQMKKILVVYNPFAGKNSRRKKEVDIRETLSRDGNEVTFYTTKCRGDATDVAEKAEGFDVIAVVGGDGTLNEVLNGLLKKEKEKRPDILYIPSGTTNQTAMAFGLPTKLDDCANLLTTGEAKPYDLGAFNGRLFIDVCSFGYGTEGSLTTSQKLKNKFGFTAFYLNQIKYLFNIKPVSMKVSSETETIEGNFVFGNLLNTSMISTFVRMEDKNVFMNDGYLDFVLVRKLKNFFYLLPTFVKLLKKKFDGKNLILLHGKEFTIEREGEMTWLIDGERASSEGRINVVNLPSCFRLYVPSK